MVCEYVHRVTYLRFHARTKHIEIYYHHVRDKISSKIIDLQHDATTNHLVDIFTKALEKNTI